MRTIAARAHVAAALPTDSQRAWADHASVDVTQGSGIAITMSTTVAKRRLAPPPIAVRAAIAALAGGCVRRANVWTDSWIATDLFRTGPKRISTPMSPTAAHAGTAARPISMRGEYAFMGPAPTLAIQAGADALTAVLIAPTRCNTPPARASWTRHPRRRLQVAVARWCAIRGFAIAMDGRATVVRSTCLPTHAAAVHAATSARPGFPIRFPAA